MPSSSEAARAVETPRVPSIAVLPFTNLTAEKESEYFSAGFAEEILDALNEVEGLRVAARASSFSFKGKPGEIGSLGVLLGVENVLKGSVRRFGNRVTITVQLEEIQSGVHLWSERYDRQREDIFEVQEQIVRAIAGRFRLSAPASLVAPTRTKLQAHELYLKGLHYAHQRSQGALGLAIQCLEEAIRLDDEFALAHTTLADCFGTLRFYGWVAAEEGARRAHAALTRAAALAPSRWEVNLTRALYTFWFERDWREAGPYFERAVESRPHSSLAQGYYGVFLATAQRAEEAIEHANAACELDPLSPFLHSLTASMLCSLGRFDTAARAAKTALELAPDYVFGLWVQGMALCGLERTDEGIASFERATTLSRAATYLGMLGFGYGRAGRVQDASRLARELDNRRAVGEHVPAWTSLCIYAGLNDLLAVRRTLAQVVAEQTPPFSLRACCGPNLDAFRSDPEVDRMLFEFYGW